MRAGLRTSLLVTIPFVLLFNADRVQITTHMYQDQSGLRRIEAAADSSLAHQLVQWTRDMTRGYQQDDYQVSANRAVISRSSQMADLDSVEGVGTQAINVVRQPLSLKTTYEFREELSVDYTYGTPKELAPAPLTTFTYVLTMPGRITNAGPGNVRVSGHTATWSFTASDANTTLSATAVAWRWDLILVALYLLGWAAYQVTIFLTRRARMRPRKI